MGIRFDGSRDWRCLRGGQRDRRWFPVSATAQVSFPIFYKGKYPGEYAADLVVGEKVIVELKCVDLFANEHLAQCINYLKASRLSVALLINFQKPKVEWKRVLLDR